MDKGHVMALISKIYQRGDESNAHYTKGVATRSTNWANVPKNNRLSRKMGKQRSINPHTHVFECKHGYGNGLVYMDGSSMSDEDMLKLLVPTDPLVLIMGA